MVGATLLFIIIIAVIAVAVQKHKDGQIKAWNEAQAQANQQALAQLKAREYFVYRQGLDEALRQARAVGDSKAVAAIMANDYHGGIPDVRDDGAYLSLYDNMRVFKIAGMAYRGDLSAYVGDWVGTIKPEMKNEYDPFAIRVQCEDGKHIGYIPEKHTDVVRWLVGVPQMVGDTEPHDFPPYRIAGHLNMYEEDGMKKYDGWVYVKKKEA